MQAKETKLQEIIEGTKQFIVPLFQRTYSWDESKWKILWEDIVELCEAENPRTHFMGSIVSLPTTSVPEGVAKFLIVDGQQRLTTIFIILIILRNLAIEKGDVNFSNEITNTLIVNPYKKDLDHYKLLPTQVDRESFINLIDNDTKNTNLQIDQAYKFYEKKFRQSDIDISKVKKIITSYFTLVSIVLDKDDNPHLVYESINYKGKPLTQADLIRNYFFMRIHADKQEEIYNKYWKTMEDDLKDYLTEFIRHYLMKEGSHLKTNDVYYTLKGKVNADNCLGYLKTLNRYSNYYKKLLNPNFETDLSIKNNLFRLNKIEVTTAYPFLLNFYELFESNMLNSSDFLEILRCLENYLVRRFVCSGYPTNQLNKIFPKICNELFAKQSSNLLEDFKLLLQNNGYPKDSEFKKNLKEGRLYGNGERAIKTKLILETLEDSYRHKENLELENLTIEHIMPQTLSEWWQLNLGDDWEMVYDLYLNNIGNLTLTGYNSELSNDDFPTKKRLYKESHLELNKYFEDISNWSRDEIEKRVDNLSVKILYIWPYFGLGSFESEESTEVTRKKPKMLFILGQKFIVDSWRDVLEQTMNTIIELEPEKFELILKNFPRFVSNDESKFRASRKLKNDAFIEVNLSAQSIQRFCNQALETIELSNDDWKVLYE